MTDPSGADLPDQDAHLLDLLRQALGGDPPPDGLVDRAAGLVAFAGMDRELAALLEQAAAEPAGLRGGGAADQRLVFEVDDGSVVVELVLARGRVDGHVLAGNLTEVVLERLDGSTFTAPVEELGGFSFQPGTGPARLRLAAGTPRPVTTDWFLL